MGNLAGSSASSLSRPVRNEPSVVFAAVAWDGIVSRLDAAILVAGFVGFMTWTIMHQDEGRRVIPAAPDVPAPVPGHRVRQVFLGIGQVILGVAGLAAGGQFIVTSAVKLATSMGISETLVGLTLVAVGTSLPELATTIVAALQDEDDMALGNIVGSNLFNILAVAGPVGLAWSLQAEDRALPIDTPVAGTAIQMQLLSMLLVTGMVYLMIIRGRGKIGRLRGSLLLATYVAVMTVWTLLK